jgi:hypothetical protein
MSSYRRTNYVQPTLRADYRGVNGDYKLFAYSFDPLTREMKSFAAVLPEVDGKENSYRFSELGGAFNYKLRTGPGWIFPANKYNAVDNLLIEIATGGAVPKSYSSGHVLQNQYPLLCSKVSDISSQDNKTEIPLSSEVSATEQPESNIVRSLLRLE